MQISLIQPWTHTEQGARARAFPVIHDHYFLGIEERCIGDDGWETPGLALLPQPTNMKLID